MAKIGLYITLEPRRGKPVTLARINDRDFLLDAAFRAISEADRKTQSMALNDDLLGELYRQEAQRLRQALETALPELRALGHNVL